MTYYNAPRRGLLFDFSFLYEYFYSGYENPEKSFAFKCQRDLPAGLGHAFIKA